MKSLVILLVSVILMSLCAEVVTSNIEPLLGGGISVVSIVEVRKVQFGPLLSI